MADLRSDFLGIKSPNPFWLASAPPTDRKTNVVRALKRDANPLEAKRWLGDMGFVVDGG